MSNAAALASTPASEPVVTLLCVDDEPNIVAALKRLFRPHGYRVLTAQSGADGLSILAGEAVDLVISDMRMPEMDGAQFLQQVRERWPDSVRVLLTGYADIASTVEAINKGEIYRYLSKPWNDQEVLLVVRHGIERRRLERENRRLEELTRKQNVDLQQLNTGLEALVEQRTAEIRSALDSLAEANGKLKASFLTSIKVFSNLIELREGREAGHSRRVADLARRLAQHLALSQTEVQDVMLAGLLHDVGKIGLPDVAMAKPESQMNGEERAQLRKHPARGGAALMALDQLRGVAALIRSHHERFDGQGYPDGLRGNAIPLGARILAVANDFDALQLGRMSPRRLTAAEARALIQQGAGKRHDSNVVAAFLELLGTPEIAPPREIALGVSSLRPGMALTRDLISREGVLLLAADYALDSALIRQFVEFERASGECLTVHIRAVKNQ
ncbi:MAG: HD domain-containing phosphohydrolase [Burkholderiales bacterium]